MEKLRTLTELLKKREGDGISQGNQGIHMNENRDGTLERMEKSREIEGIETINHEGW